LASISGRPRYRFWMFVLVLRISYLAYSQRSSEKTLLQRKGYDAALQVYSQVLPAIVMSTGGGRAQWRSPGDPAARAWPIFLYKKA